MASYLYKIEITKYNTSEVIKVIHLAANNLVEASHIAAFYVYEKDMFPNNPVEIISVVRDMNVEDIINADVSGGDGEEEEISDPLDTEGIADEDLIVFKHTCDHTVRILDNEWVAVSCPSCSTEILRSDIQNVSGVWIYVHSSKKRKK